VKCPICGKDYLDSEDCLHDTESLIKRIEELTEENQAFMSFMTELQNVMGMIMLVFEGLDLKNWAESKKKVLEEGMLK